MEISVVSPVYLGAESLAELVHRIDSAVSELQVGHEIILVEDGSPDRSWQEVVRLCGIYPHVKALRLSRNFGQHYAVTAGLQAATGSYVIVIDCDLQDDPAYIPQLYLKAREGYDVVYTIKRERKHSGVKNRFSKLFHWLVNKLVTDQRQQTNSNVGNYSLLSRDAVRAFLRVTDYHRHYLGIVRWIGFSTASIVTEHKTRPYGKTSYTLWKLVHEAINGITSQSDKLLYASILLGFGFMFTALISAAFIVASYFLSGFQEGWTSIIVLILLSTGVVLMSLGVVGVYIGKIFEQTKQRPLFLIKEAVNFEGQMDLREPYGFVPSKLDRLRSLKSVDGQGN